MALRLVPRPDVPTLEAAGDVPGLLELLSDPDPDTRREAARALSRLGRRATGDLLGVIGHPDPGVRLGVVEVLGESGNPGAAGPLVRLLGNRCLCRLCRFEVHISLGRLDCRRVCR